MTTARQNFIDAQQRMLDRHGVEAEARFVDIPSIGGQAHALVCGEGPAVVMINGNGTPGAMWAPLMAHLEGFRMFAVDLPGYGLTRASPRMAKDLRPRAVRFLTEALDALGLDRPAFIANSLGSLWSCWLALDRPQRVGAMAHIGSPALALDTSALLPMRLLSAPPLGRLLTRLQPPSPKQVERLGRMVKEHPLPPELVDLLVATERLPGFRETFLSTLHALLRLRGARPAMQLTAEQLAQISQPTLLVWGKDEPFAAPEVGERMVSAMPAAELHIVEGGHAPWLREAERIGAIARPFLERALEGHAAAASG